MKSLLHILSHLKPYKLQVSLNVVFNILSALFGVISFLMIIPFLDVLFYPMPEMPIPKPPFELTADGVKSYVNYWLDYLARTEGIHAALILICIMVFVATFFKNLFRYLALYIMTPVKNGVIYDLRKKLFDKVTVLPVSYYSEEKKGDIITRSSSDLQTFEFSILNVLETYLKEPFNILITLSFLFILSPKLTLIVLVLLPVSGLIIGRLGKTLKVRSHSVQQHLSNLISVLDETISGIKIVKAFNAEKQQKQLFDKTNTKYTDESVRMQRRIYLASPLTETLGITVAVLILYIGSTIVLYMDSRFLTPSSFIAYLALFGQLINPSKAFSNAMYHVQKGNASLERIEQVLNEDIRVKEATNPVSKKNLDSTIKYDRISFAYDQKSVLRDIDITIPKGQLTALVGQSGSGKSTFVDLLSRFYDVNKGGIYLDDVNIRDIRLFDLRALIGIVSQEPILFNDTVHNNIVFGMEHYTREEVIQAAHIANAHNYIEKMDKGYDTVIGERGVKLSGGEKQRLTIARAVLKNPPILVLDEATSSLDTESEKLVQEALYKLMENRTSIVIAHRLSTIQHADKILVMHDGQIIEQGTHQDLIDHNGTYRKLVEMQAF